MNTEEDKENILWGLRNGSIRIADLKAEYQTNKVFGLEAVKGDNIALRYLSENLQDDKEVVLEAIKRSGTAIAYASERLRNDKEVAFAAVKNNGVAIFYLEAILREDLMLGVVAVEDNIQVLDLIEDEIKLSKDFLYKIKDVLEKNKDERKEEYELLKKFEREEYLTINLKDEKTNKIGINKRKV